MKKTAGLLVGIGVLSGVMTAGTIYGAESAQALELQVVENDQEDELTGREGMTTDPENKEEYPDNTVPDQEGEEKEPKNEGEKEESGTTEGWKKLNGHQVYQYADGSYAVGVVKIGGGNIMRSGMSAGGRIC